ncbi:uncharacterized protein [Odocoileus virginianus]|uniref:N-terminal Ras-GEF domain-containing protein n=1 Tax=Odocoileus virginianus TaxID=9874 RepID=A0ABM4HUB6_ODOVR
MRVSSHLCLRTLLEVPAGIIPGVQVGTPTGFERQGLIQDGEQVGNGSVDPRLSGGRLSASSVEVCAESGGRVSGGELSGVREAPQAAGRWPETFCPAAGHLFTGLLTELQTGASPQSPCSTSLHEGQEPLTSDRAQGGHRDQPLSPQFSSTEWEVLDTTTGMMQLTPGELSNTNCPETLTHVTMAQCQFTLLDAWGLSLSSSPCLPGVFGSASDSCLCCVPPQGESVSAGDRNETCRVWSVQRCRLETLVGNLVPVFLGRHPAYLATFLGTYRAFGAPKQVLDLLFTRYGCILPYCDEDSGPLHQLKTAMASILGTWLQVYPEDFLQSPERPCLKMLLAYVQLSMPDSDLEQRARHLLAQLETLEPTEAEGHAPAGEAALETSPDLEPTAPLLPATAPQSEQAQSPAPIQVQGLYQINMPAPNPVLQRAHAMALP